MMRDKKPTAKPPLEGKVSCVYADGEFGATHRKRPNWKAATLPFANVCAKADAMKRMLLMMMVHFRPYWRIGD